jgi:hypothetical protein
VALPGGCSGYRCSPRCRKSGRVILRSWPRLVKLALRSPPA